MCVAITFQIAFLCVHAPRGHIYLRFLPPPSSPQRRKPGYAEIIFAHILVFPACAIEVQHINENSPTMKFTCDYSFTPIPFLDVSVSLHNGKIVTDLYTKPTDKHQYLLNKENIK